MKTERCTCAATSAEPNWRRHFADCKAVRPEKRTGEGQSATRAAARYFGAMVHRGVMSVLGARERVLRVRRAIVRWEAAPEWEATRLGQLDLVEGILDMTTDLENLMRADLATAEQAGDWEAPPLPPPLEDEDDE